MIEIFKTDINESETAKQVKQLLLSAYPTLQITIDLEDKDRILRIAAQQIDKEAIILKVNNLGFKCIYMPDKICDDNSAARMQQFWETSFTNHRAIWGQQPATSALITSDLFVAAGIKDVLIPGVGYGRNAEPFLAQQMMVTGIEISETAVEMAKTTYGNKLRLYHGSVTDMPFETKQYDGIFCHALLHLFNPTQRAQLLKACYEQLSEGGYMVFTVVTVHSPNYGRGKEIATNTYEITKGGQIYFYDEAAILNEFSAYGLVSYKEIGEQIDAKNNQPAFSFYWVCCKKQSLQNTKDQSAG